MQRLKNSLVYDIAQMPTGTTGIKVRELADDIENCSISLNIQCEKGLNGSSSRSDKSHLSKSVLVM